MQKLCDEMARLQDQIDATNTWELDREIEIAFDVMNLPPRDAEVETLSGGERRRVALCKLLLAAARSAAARRADESPGRRGGGLARTAPGGVSRHRGGRHPRPLFPGQRGPMDSGTGPGTRNPLGGKLLLVAGAEAAAAGTRRKTRRRARKTLERELEWIRLAPRARQAKSKARIKAYEQMAAERYEERLGRVRNPDSARASTWATW